jgi:hypothetical protein
MFNITDLRQKETPGKRAANPLADQSCLIGIELAHKIVGFYMVPPRWVNRTLATGVGSHFNA